MQAEYFNLLPAQLKDMIREIEHEIGFPIDVAVDPARARDLEDGPVPMACEVGPRVARLLISAADQFPPGAVFHELQHILRFLVEGVPCLVDCQDYELWNPEMGTALTRHDNALEHLVIVPRELEVFAERRAHWEAVIARVWAGIGAGEGSDVARRQLGMACWVFLQLVMPESPSVDSARRILQRSGAMESAERFCQALRPALVDKSAAIRVWFEHQGIPLEMASLKYFVPREGRSWEVPLAERA
ncbi:hypothetical protein [Burkholderia sp. PU8-34]